MLIMRINPIIRVYVSSWINSKGHFERVLAIQADIGGKTRRLEFATQRLKRE